MKEKQGY